MRYLFTKNLENGCEHVCLLLTPYLVAGSSCKWTGLWSALPTTTSRRVSQSFEQLMANLAQMMSSKAKICLSTGINYLSSQSSGKTFRRSTKVPLVCLDICDNHRPLPYSAQGRGGVIRLVCTQLFGWVGLSNVYVAIRFYCYSICEQRGMTIYYTTYVLDLRSLMSIRV